MSAIKRVQPGVPTGGEFASRTRDESDVSLSAAKSLTVDVPIHWVTMELPSPRHRNLQPVEHQGFQSTSIRTVTAEDAPEVFTIPVTSRFCANSVRTFEGEIFTQNLETDDEPTPVTDAWMRSRLANNRYDYRPTEETVRSAAESLFESSLSIDGELWEKLTIEPRYKVMTFGMGHNHGGTSLGYEVSNWTNADDESLFLADEHNEAVAYAVKVAEERGDDKSVDRIRSLEPIVVHDHSLIGSTVTRTIRLDLPPAYNVTRETFPATKQTYLAQLGRVPGAIVTAADGTRRVDYDKLTKGQAYATKRLLIEGAEQGII